MSQLYGITNGAPAKLIWGDGANSAEGNIVQCDTNDICLTRELLAFFFRSIDATQDIVENLFPATTATSAFVTKIQAYAWMNDFTFVRFVWLQRNPGKLFYETDPRQCYALLDIYLEFNLTSWITDPIVKDLPTRVG